jgi:hypothetical protein
MTQEIQVILTLEVDAEKSKVDVTRYILGMETYYRNEKSPFISTGIEKITKIEVKQESEIYKNK